MSDIERIRREWLDALRANAAVVIDLGQTVVCDACDTDLTGSDRSGGFLFGSYAYGPCCAIERMAAIRGYGEEHFIRARCPEGVSFADWVRGMRQATGSNSIVITPGRPQ